MKGFLNKCEKTQYMSSVINDEKILEKYGLIWNKISVIIKKEFDAQPVYSEKYASTKIKSHNSKIKTENNGTKLHTEKSACYCLSKILFDSVCKKNGDDKYYPQVYLEECKYQERKRRKKRLEKEKIIIPDRGESDDESTE